MTERVVPILQFFLGQGVAVGAYAFALCCQSPDAVVHIPSAVKNPFFAVKLDIQMRLSFRWMTTSLTRYTPFISALDRKNKRSVVWSTSLAISPPPLRVWLAISSDIGISISLPSAVEILQTNAKELASAGVEPSINRIANILIIDRLTFSSEHSERSLT